MGFEPTTPWLGTKSSTAELRSHFGAGQGSRTPLAGLEAQHLTARPGPHCVMIP